ncbi:helix-turn-helix domain-containing protein [Actinomadura logoneensis]|uniref:helix-turn-helix domain-containing protein n=1 Tax=Actinomadura logoneensis TaxID=2293572 RepID=UPI0011C1B587|nr:helix-turn-helix transcriptional regulator [Actinomadura logoneensis]
MEVELRAVLEGETPSSAIVRQIAPVLNFHEVDLLLIAGIKIPEDLLLPMDERVRPWISVLVGISMGLSLDRILQLRRRVRSFPLEVVEGLSQISSYGESGQTTIPSLIVQLFEVRNMDLSAMAKMLHRTTGGALYISPSTISRIERGDRELTSEFLVGSSVALGLPVRQMSALTGIALADVVQDPILNHVAEMVWEARALNLGQMQQLIEEAES